MAAGSFSSIEKFKDDLRQQILNSNIDTTIAIKMKEAAKK